MKGYWLETLGKVAGYVFSFKAGSYMWKTVVILDSIRSRQRSTIQGNLYQILSLLKEGKLVSLCVKVFPCFGPFPIVDQSGVGVGCLIMKR